MSYKNVECKREDESLFKVHIVPRVFAMVAKYGDKRVRKYWNGKSYDYKEDEKKDLTDAILEWSKLD
jgi:hypothetical protein